VCVCNAHSLPVTSTCQQVSGRNPSTSRQLWRDICTLAPETFTAAYLSFYKLRERESHDVCCITAGVAANPPAWLIFPQNCFILWVRSP